MDRVLNRSLFGSQKTETQTQVETPKDSARPMDKADLQIVSIQLENLKKKVKELEGRLETSEGRLEALAQATKIKIEQNTAKQERLELYVRATVKDLAEKFASLAGKLTSSKLAEDKIEALLTRHNQVVQNFENRMSQMQKLVNEQELKLLALKR